MTVRQQKVAAQLRRLVSEALAREVHDPRVGGLVTVTRVEVTPDLRDARVYVSILSAKSTPKTVLAGIQSAGRRIQSDVAPKLALRVLPRLTFHLDETLKKEAEMLRKIDAVTHEREGHVAPEAPAE